MQFLKNTQNIFYYKNSEMKSKIIEKIYLLYIVHSSQGLRTTVQKHSRLQHGISDPEVPKLTAYYKPYIS